MKIFELTDEVLRKIKQDGLSEKTFVHYVGSAYNPIVKEYVLRFGDEADKENLVSLREEYVNLLQNSKRSRDSCLTKIRALNNMIMLLDGNEYKRVIFPSYKRKVESVCEKYAPSYNEFLQSINHLNHIYTCVILARRFFVFLEKKCNSPDIKDLTFDHCRLFMSDDSRGFNNSPDLVAYVLKKLFQFFNDTGMNTDKTWKLIKSTAPRSKKIIPAMPQEDIVTTVKSLDEDTMANKRDAAIITLMSVSALRCCDLSSLKLSDINWRENVITVFQSKTQNYVTVPVEHKFLEPVADYILNWRPKSSSEYIFLSVRHPYRKLEPDAISSLIGRDIKRAGINHVPGDGKTAHGIRRALPTEIVIQGTPLTLAGEIIGHVGIESTRYYVSLNTEELRRCAISLSSIRKCRNEDYY